MVRVFGKYLFVAAAIVAALMVSASEAQAFGHGCGYGWGCYQPVAYSCGYGGCWSSCYTPCVSACYDPCCSSSWYAGGRLCGVGRWVHGPYRWYYAGGAGCYWGSCYTGCVSDCGVDVGCCGSEVGTSVETQMPSKPTLAPAPEAPTMPAPAPETPPAPAPTLETPPAPAAEPPTTFLPTTPPTTPQLPGQPTTSTATPANTGLLTVWVPAHAKVYINGVQTTTEGSRRRYVSYGLQSGLTYKYEVRAELVRNGQLAEETQTIYLTAGANEGLAFGFNREPIAEVAAAQ